mgnify:CR=1 FL=1
MTEPSTPQNGAESLVTTLAASGVGLCFANPGTSEMHFVAALDRIPGVRCVLGLFEGVVTGAADGYYRMAGTPADARAVAWAKAKFEALGFDKVYLEPVTFPVWLRHRERAEILAPFPQPLVVTALGGSEVRAYCASSSESRNTAGASESCGAYTCNATSGLCRDRCASSNDCDSSARCDIPSGTCVAVPGG